MAPPSPSQAAHLHVPLLLLVTGALAARVHHRARARVPPGALTRSANCSACKQDGVGDRKSLPESPPTSKARVWSGLHQGRPAAVHSVVRNVPGWQEPRSSPLPSLLRQCTAGAPAGWALLARSHPTSSRSCKPPGDRLRAARSAASRLCSLCSLPPASQPARATHPPHRRCGASRQRALTQQRRAAAAVQRRRRFSRQRALPA